MPLPALRKHLSTPGLLGTIRQCFAKITDTRAGCPIPLVEDGLASHGPHIQLLESLGMSDILGAKPGDHPALFDAVQTPRLAGTCEAGEFTDAQGVEHGYRWVNGLPLNASPPDLHINFLEYWDIHNGQERVWSGVTDLPLSRANVEAVMRGGRARWKVEHETFNALKNQGYGLEHNDGHGQQHLATNFALLMMLAFRVDQAQERGCFGRCWPPAMPARPWSPIPPRHAKPRASAGASFPQPLTSRPGPRMHKPNPPYRPIDTG